MVFSDSQTFVLSKTWYLRMGGEFLQKISET